MSSRTLPGLHTSPIATAGSKSNDRPSASSTSVHCRTRTTQPLAPSSAAAPPLGCRPPASQKVKTGKRQSTMTTMASSGSPNTATFSGFTEMEHESDFDLLLQPDDCISICGFGSLLSERSARSTFPELENFRVGRLRGFRRVFCHTAPVFFQRGIAKQETGEISSLSVEPCEGETLLVTVFEIKRSEIPSFIEREHEFRFLAVTPEDLNGTPYGHPAVLCTGYSDEEYFRIRCKGSQETLFQRYGQYNIQKIWRNDILPCRVYLRHCVLAAKNLGEAAGDNFLDHTFLGDRKTTIRLYLSSTGSGIMEEEPPEALKTRYGASQPSTQ